jgi:hypothetical protein
MAPVANYPELGAETAFIGRVAFPARPPPVALRALARASDDDWDLCFAEDEYVSLRPIELDAKLPKHPLKALKSSEVNRWVLFVLWFNTYRYATR